MDACLEVFPGWDGLRGVQLTPRGVAGGVEWTHSQYTLRSTAEVMEEKYNVN